MVAGGSRTFNLGSSAAPTISARIAFFHVDRAQCDRHPCQHGLHRPSRAARRNSSTAYLKLLEPMSFPVVRRTGSIRCADIGLMGQIGGGSWTGSERPFTRAGGCRRRDALPPPGIQPTKMAPRDSLASLSVMP